MIRLSLSLENMSAKLQAFERENPERKESSKISIKIKGDETSRETEKEEKAKINPPNYSHIRKSSKTPEKKFGGKINIIYEDKEKNDQKTKQIKSPYTNINDSLKQPRNKIKTLSYVIPKESSNRSPPTSLIMTEQLESPNKELISPIIISKEKAFASSDSFSEEEKDRDFRSSFPLNLKKEKDFFLNTNLKSKKKDIKELTSPMGPSFANLKKIDRNYSVNAEAANNLVNKIIENEKLKKLRNSMTRLNILKMIAIIYTEKVMNTQNNLNNPLNVLVYDMFLNKYGLKKIAENKYKQVYSIF